MDIINFDKKSVKEYLDSCINHWRGILNDPKHEHHDIAIYYCDAFQSVRVSLFGELLPPRE